MTSTTVLFFAFAWGAVMLASVMADAAIRQYLEFRHDLLRFRLSAARDRLYLGVADGVIPADSTAFKFLLTALDQFSSRAESVDFSVITGLVLGDEAAMERGRQMRAELSPEGLALMDGILIESLEVFVEQCRLNSRLFRVLRRILMLLDKYNTGTSPAAAHQAERAIKQYRTGGFAPA